MQQGKQDGASSDKINDSDCPDLARYTTNTH
jgi:hypothetical protein